MLNLKVKSYLKSIAGIFGYDIVRARASEGERRVGLFEVLLEHYILTSGGARGAILQVGANDGVRCDPIAKLIRKHKLKAVLIEPLPDMFEDLRRNYAGIDSVIFENVAISTSEGCMTIYRISRDAKDVPDWAHGIASFSREHLMKSAKSSDVTNEPAFLNAIESVSVPVKTVRQIVDKYDVSNILALQVDTEGHDFVVVKSAIAAGCTPIFIHYEHANLSLSEQRACRSMLMRSGYSFVTEVNDTVAIRNP